MSHPLSTMSSQSLSILKASCTWCGYSADKLPRCAQCHSRLYCVRIYAEYVGVNNTQDLLQNSNCQGLHRSRHIVFCRSVCNLKGDIWTQSLKQMWCELEYKLKIHGQTVGIQNEMKRSVTLTFLYHNSF